jgi:hypothetical protein
MNHQIDAVEWPSFNQKKHLRMSLGSPFFALTLLSLPQPQTGASLTWLQGVHDFIGFQNMFLSMNHQSPTAEWLAIDQKRHSMLRIGIPFSAWTRLSLPRATRGESTTPWLSNW